MAKRKKRGGSRKRGRRMGAASFTGSLKKNEDFLILGAGVVVGAVAKGFIDQALAKQDTIKVNQNMVDGVEVAAGVAGVLYLDGAFLKGLSIGVGSAGAVSGLRTLGVIKGTSPMRMVPFRARLAARVNNMNGGVTRTPGVAGGNSYGFPSPPGVGASLRRKTGSY